MSEEKKQQLILDTELKTLGKVIIQLGDCTKELATQLEPICVPLPKKDEEKAVEESTEKSPIGASLTDATRRIRHIKNKIILILETLER